MCNISWFLTYKIIWMPTFILKDVFGKCHQFLLLRTNMKKIHMNHTIMVNKYLWNWKKYNSQLQSTIAWSIIFVYIHDPCHAYQFNINSFLVIHHPHHHCLEWRVIVIAIVIVPLTVTQFCAAKLIRQPTQLMTQWLLLEHLHIGSYTSSDAIGPLKKNVCSWAPLCHPCCSDGPMSGIQIWKAIYIFVCHDALFTCSWKLASHGGSLANDLSLLVTVANLRSSLFRSPWHSFTFSFWSYISAINDHAAEVASWWT